MPQVKNLLKASIRNRASDNIALVNSIGTAVGPIANEKNKPNSVLFLNDQEYYIDG